MISWYKLPDIKMTTQNLYTIMKKLFVIIIGFGLLFAFTACEDEEILPLPEYVAIHPKSWTFGVIDAAVSTFTYEFKLTTFEPQSYTISKLQLDADKWITGSTDLATVDISNQQPNATITGSLNTADVFANLVVGEEAMLRLTLTSKKGNTNVAIPWQTVTIDQ